MTDLAAVRERARKIHRTCYECNMQMECAACRETVVGLLEAQRDEAALAGEPFPPDSRAWMANRQRARVSELERQIEKARRGEGV